MEIKATNQELWAARAILYVAKGICSVEFPGTNAGCSSSVVRVVRNARDYQGIEMLVPVTFDGELWDLIVPSIADLAVSPFRDLDRDLLPVALEILRDAYEEWGTPELEESPEHPAGQRTPGWSATFDPFDP